ncbi:hypothetical protein DV736_g554, partial [Chaetothyriales sp. CBS 134916]
MASFNRTAADSDDFVRRSQEFVHWFRNAPGTRLSAKIELADLRHKGAGRGVVATEDIAQDEELFAVPRSLQLLKKEQSKWYPYFRVLPAAFDSLMFWNDDELAELQASSVRRRIGKEQADADFKEKAWPAMKADPEFFNFQGASDDECAEQALRLCHYAGSLIMAYAFDIDRDDSNLEEDNQSSLNKAEDENDDDDDLQSDDEDNPLKGLVPFADMLNADADGNNARLFQEDDGYLIMKAIKPINAGDECLNDYGPLPRSELLRMYGYVTDNYKQYDVVDFDLDLLEKTAGDRRARSKAWQRRKSQLEEMGVLDDGYSFPRPNPTASLDDAIPGDLHMVLREAALLSAVATKKLSEYATSWQSDTADNQPTAPPAGVSAKRYKTAVEVRIGEKEILLQILALCTDFIAAKTNDQKRKIINGHKLKTGK